MPRWLFCAVFRDRIQKAKIGSFEVELAVHVTDQLQTAFDLKVEGDYEGSESETQQAFHRFLSKLNVNEFKKYCTSMDYQRIVLDILQSIVPKSYGGEVLNSSGTGSLFPVG